MKKYLLIVLALVFTPLVGVAADFKEGVEYTVVQKNASSKPVVTEFFSYVCPHCYSFQPLMKELEQRHPEVQFNKVPVAFLGKDMGPVLQRAYGAAVLLKVEDTLTPVIFDQIHNQKNMPKGISDIKATFVENGVTEKDFDGVINSFALNGMIAKFDKTTDKFDVHGTPTVIVNDKYELNMSEIGSADRFYEVVDYLLAQ
ncbi:MAG: thiol:disulfide interchange protein DsbA/DsbL [Aeromonadales bacterium]|nr:thiol:disulfide interchange protein DsbA/DsbL [Aeromonadales bacterium]